MKSVLARNSTEKISLPSGKAIHVPKCVTCFERWRGKSVRSTYGGKAVLTFRNKPLFAELVVLRHLEREGWKGVWVDSYSRKYRVGMPGVSEPVMLPKKQEAPIDKIRTKAGRRGGCFDVFAWRGNKYRFVELKRRDKDRIQPTQKRWLQAARRCGVKMSDLFILEWGRLKSRSELGFRESAVPLILRADGCEPEYHLGLC